jgi:hypothetical protein
MISVAIKPISSRSDLRIGGLDGGRSGRNPSLLTGTSSASAAPSDPVGCVYSVPRLTRVSAVEPCARPADLDEFVLVLVAPAEPRVRGQPRARPRRRRAPHRRPPADQARAWRRPPTRRGRRQRDRERGTGSKGRDACGDCARPRERGKRGLADHSLSLFRQRATATRFEPSGANYLLPPPAFCAARFVRCSEPVAVGVREDLRAVADAGQLRCRASSAIDAGSSR